ncbi:MAG: metallophosphatase family protein [Actinomycetota bacterium]|nr:metallophosphatase family protein [Actinomycetota bacterium]
MLVLVLADTHIPRRAKGLPEELMPHLERADLVLHAGDLLEAAVLDAISGYAPVRAVRGNVDGPDVYLPQMLELELGGVPIAMIHDSGPKKGRHARMRRRFPEARVVVFGHSHIPLLEESGEVMLLNPGSPTDKRRQPEPSFGLLWAEGGVVRAEVRTLGGELLLRSGTP